LPRRGRGVKLPSARDGYSGSRPRLDQFCGAFIADQGALVGDEAEPEIETNPVVLLGLLCDYPVAAQASVRGFHPALIDGA
jgi:hypothetical protein